jgi:type II secretory pathway pseudopilin PulG
MIAIHRKRAFTFVELLAAMVFLAIVIPTAMAGITLSARQGIVAVRKNNASLLADRKLTEEVLTDDWRTEDTSGDFGDDWPGYRWQISDEVWDVDDSFRVLTVEVFFDIQGKTQSTTLTALVKNAEDTEDTTEDSE